MKDNIENNEIESVTGGTAANPMRPWEGFPCPKCGVASLVPYGAGGGWAFPELRCNNCGHIMGVDECMKAQGLEYLRKR
jgi:predicted RNA-binding Zn-ribbon protein involved in translation (DUF1610 family)